MESLRSSIPTAIAIQIPMPSTIIRVWNKRPALRGKPKLRFLGVADYLKRNKRAGVHHNENAGNHLMDRNSEITTTLSELPMVMLSSFSSSRMLDWMFAGTDPPIVTGPAEGSSL
jgi:hypothetical protein